MIDKIITFIHVLAWIFLVWKVLYVLGTWYNLHEYKTDPIRRAKYILQGTLVDEDATKRNIIKGIIWVISLIAFIIIF